MESLNFDKLVNMNIEDVMKVSEVKLVKPESSKRIDEQNFEFNITISTVTDPEWRLIFEKKHGKKNVNFQGSKAVLTCRPTELQEEVTMLKFAIAETNLVYREKREALIEKITNAKKQEKEAVINRLLEDEQVKKMFEKFEI
ncbi:hypothetical protein K3H45_16625 [Aeromonas veronii]|uniref:hypothetical protein n=1 Tax=Aeromonas veronii TaxID=654 RepID=UPI001F1F7BBA|nr:hypothetical protein [Aeromonas veronii]MCF5761499.1 hypothetical protein [Aeromonas veronii]